MERERTRDPNSCSLTFENIERKTFDLGVRYDKAQRVTPVRIGQFNSFHIRSG